MTILHVDDHPITRATLSDLIGAVDGRLGHLDYVATDIVDVAEQMLSHGTVQVLILDLGLNPGERPNLLKLVRDRQSPVPRAEQDFDAYRLALLASDHKVPCALLTNWRDHLNKEKGLSLDDLRDAFHAEEVFGKDEAGMIECAAWVRQRIRRG